VAKAHIDAELMTVFGMANEEMPWCYSAADAMILCSDHEGSPTSIKEALACNLPVVTTDVGDVRELLSGVAGSWICAQEVGAIADTLRAALDISRSGQFEGRVAMAKYDQALTVEKILGVYTNAICQFRARTWRRVCDR
jgi:teichuronic acid biosynthesis glycosyltransferase TuaC